MKLTFAKVGWVLCLGALCVLTISAINYKKQGGVTDVTINVLDTGDGHKFLSDSVVYHEVMDYLDGVLPEDITHVDIDEVEVALRSNPFVKHVDVYISGDGQLGVKISQREPIARVIDSRSGNGSYIDSEGAFIPESPNFTPRLLVVTGDIPREEEAGNMASSSLIELIEAISSDPFYLSLVEQIDIRNGEATIVPKAGSALIQFGQLDNPTERLKNLKEFYKQVYVKRGFDYYASIDLSIDGQIICKDNKKTN